MDNQPLTKKERLQQQREEKTAKKEQQVKKTNLSKAMIAAVVVVIVAGLIWLLATKSNSSTVTDISPDPSLGPETAPVLVEAYEDFQCPACAAAAPVVKSVLAEYGDQVRFEYNDFPLPQHEYGATAAIAGECAFEQDLFFPLHDVLYAKQDEWSAVESTEAVEEMILGYAEEVGINRDQFLSCTASEATADKVDEDIAEARSIRVNSTPSFFVNGERVVSSSFSAGLRAAIDKALGK